MSYSEIEEIAVRIDLFFEGDVHKTGLWMITPNPLLGYVAPRDMIRVGRHKKLLEFIRNQLDEVKEC